MENKENIQPELTTNDKFNIFMLSYLANKSIRNHIDEQYGFFQEDLLRFADENDISWENAYEEVIETFKLHIEVLYKEAMGYF